LFQFEVVQCKVQDFDDDLSEGTAVFMLVHPSEGAHFCSVNTRDEKREWLQVLSAAIERAASKQMNAAKGPIRHQQEKVLKLVPVKSDNKREDKKIEV